jgi:N-acetylneuraminate synthase
MAVTLGADMIEFHGTLDRTSYGSDQAASIEPRGVFELMEKIKLTEQMLGDGIKKIHDSEIPIMKKLRR